MAKITKLTHKSIEETIATIKESDYETAHGIEDDLYQTFIEGIANNLYSLNEIIIFSKMIITTKDIKFPRHCA